MHHGDAESLWLLYRRRATREELKMRKVYKQDRDAFPITRMVFSWYAWVVDMRSDLETAFVAKYRL